MSEEPVLRFRNYVPRDAALAQHVVAPALPAAPAAAAAGGDAAPLPEPDAPVLLVPKRANWDLKRDIAPKLESLERMTQRAIAELVQSKVAAAASAAASGGGGASSSSGSSSGSGSSSSSADGSAGGAAGGAQQPQGESLDDLYAGPIDTALLSARVAALEAGEGQ